MEAFDAEDDKLNAQIYQQVNFSEVKILRIG